MDLQEVGCDVRDWIGLGQDRDRWQALVNVVMNLWVPWNKWNFLTGWKLVSLSRRTLFQGVFLVLLLRHCHVVSSTLTLINLWVTKTSDVFVTVNRRNCKLLNFLPWDIDEICNQYSYIFINAFHSNVFSNMVKNVSHLTNLVYLKIISHIKLY